MIRHPMQGGFNANNKNEWPIEMDSMPFFCKKKFSNLWLAQVDFGCDIKV